MYPCAMQKYNMKHIYNKITAAPIHHGDLDHNVVQYEIQKPGISETCFQTKSCVFFLGHRVSCTVPYYKVKITPNFT